MLDPAADARLWRAAAPRREMIAEDRLVLEWLKQVQDAGTPEKQLLPSTLKSDEGQTFNNSVVAMAFIRHDERERAERILNFFQQAMADRQNEDPSLQSFYLRGEARGFYQWVSLPRHGQRQTLSCCAKR